jgi:Tfp pilus assembly protein PilF
MNEGTRDRRVADLRRSRRNRRLILVALGLVLTGGCASSPPHEVRRAERNPAADTLSAWERETRSRAHYDLGVDHLSKGQTALALREFLASLEYTPDDPWIHLGLGECYRRNSLYEQAEHHLLRAIHLKTRFQTAELNLSALYANMERYDESAEWAQRLIDDPTYPAPWRAYNNLGWAHLKAGRPDQGRKALETALQYDTGFWPAHLNLGILESEAGHMREAIEHFEQVLERNPGPYAEAEVRYRMGELFVSLGNRGRAVELFTAAADSPLGGPWGKKSQDYLKLLQ